MSRKIITFPHVGNYYIPFSRLFKTVFPEAEILPPPPITKKTLETGCRYSPDYVCAPFKYNVGNFIEALEMGANILVQTGTGCRYGYYAEVQEQILRDLGFDLSFVYLSRENASPSRIYKTFKDMGSPLSLPGFIRAGLFALESIRIMDKFEFYIRENIGFETNEGEFEKIHSHFLTELTRVSSFGELAGLKARYAREYSNVRLYKTEDILRVGIVGELFTLMEPFSNFYLERELAKSGVSVSRIMSVSFLLSPHKRKSLRGSKEYLKYDAGANGADSVFQTVTYANKGYDGVIHMKSFGCIPELNVMPALQNISTDFDMPVLHLSFDSHTGETGIQTRLEAFADMIKMRKERQYEKSASGCGYRLNFNERSRDRLVK